MLKYLTKYTLCILTIIVCAITTTRCQEVSPPPATQSRLLNEWLKKPLGRHWLANWLITGCDTADCTKASAAQHAIEYEGYDGFYNNLAHPDLGAIDTPLLRRVPAAYEDGVYKPSGGQRPEPLELSEQLMKGTIGSKSRLGRTALLVFFGQQVVEEILDAQRPACPPEYFNIKIPPHHTYHINQPKHTELPLLRTRYDARTGYSPNNPRQQLNEITPWLDGGLTYGTTKSWADQLRTYRNGTLDPKGLLAFSQDGLFPEVNSIRLPMANPPPPACHAKYVKRHSTEEVSRFYKLGNPRGNENPFLLSFGVLWFRWHNYLAKQISKTHSDWSGDKVFNEARKWVIATHQHIVVNEWLPKWLGSPLPQYIGYNPSIDPQIDQFFQSAAFRFGHTLVPPGVYLRDYARNGCNITLNGGDTHNGSVRTCNSFWQPQKSIESKYINGGVMDIDRLLMGMALQLCEEEDHKIVEDLRGQVFGPLEFSRRDLMAVNIQRGRDHGLPDFNTARQAFNLEPVTNVTAHFDNVDRQIIQAFSNLYKNSMDDVDVWVGGLLETRDGPGELFTAIIKDQFSRIRDGDRFWYNNRQNKLFTSAEIERLENLRLYDVIIAVTKMDHDDIQTDVFRAPLNPTEIHENCRRRLVEGKCTNTTCHHLPQLDTTTVDSCVEPGTYDYFVGSEASFIATYVSITVVILSFIGLVWILAAMQHKKSAAKMQRIASRVRESFKKDQVRKMPYSAREWVDRKTVMRQVVIILETDKQRVQVCNQRGIMLRAMDVKHSQTMQIFLVSDGLHVLLRVSHDYDLILKFDTEFLRSNFVPALEEFISKCGIKRERINITLNAALRQAVTRKTRQKRLEVFFRVVFSQAFHISHSEDEILRLDSGSAKEVIYTELTANEFAEALSMRADSEFVKKMFALVDKDKNGFISFREFVDMLIIFANGTADDKAKLMFDMYDINGTGLLTREDFTNMIKSFMETVNAAVEQADLESVVNHMLMSAGLLNKQAMDVKDFQRLLLDYKDKLNYAELSFTGIPSTGQMQRQQGRSNRAHSFIEEARQTAASIYVTENKNTNLLDVEHAGALLQRKPTIDKDQEQVIKNIGQNPPPPNIFRTVHRYIENYALDIFWMTLYTLVLLAIFAERSYYYAVESEHTGLRRIAGYGVTVTRGAASAMMFTYSSLLVTMCRNTITVLRDTFMHKYFPFDSAVSMHKYIAMWALVFTILHVGGHASNFYSISTQTSDDLTCLFRNYFHATHEIPKFHYWCWQTITGVTGVLLTLLTALIFVFAMPFARTKLYNAFWFTHSLYPVFFLLMILHGAGRLIQPPFTHYFFLGPCVLFVLDNIITIRRKKVEIPVINAELLPSNVTMLEFQKPSNFEYRSGQWVRVACLGLNSGEYHPFTLSSAPHEKNLTIHIRAVGPWTTNIRSLYDPTLLREKPLPKIHLDGPFGEGHQDWYQFDIAVLIGGGIGVTPFASILKDIVFRKNAIQQSTCKKVYFLWVTKTQKQFEWLVDIIRDLENADQKDVVSVHIFITQFYQKFDLRTILLYICERHFQKVCNKSLFTGLKAVTHFGRPDFRQFFKSLQGAHPKAGKVGVFSCGPPPMTQLVDKECVAINKETIQGPVFQHHSKNF